MFRVKMPFDTEVLSVVEFLFDVFTGRFWLESEGVSREINNTFTVFLFWNVKTAAKMPEGVLRISFFGKGIRHIEISQR